MANHSVHQISPRSSDIISKTNFVKMTDSTSPSLTRTSSVEASKQMLEKRRCVKVDAVEKKYPVGAVGDTPVVRLCSRLCR